MRGVEPGIRLGHAEAGAVGAGDDRRQEAALLFLAAEFHDRLAAEHVHVQRRTRIEAVAADFGHDDGGLGEAQAGAADFLREDRAEPAGLGEGAGEFVREFVVQVLVVPVVLAELRTDAGDAVADLPLFVGEHEVHRRVSVAGRPIVSRGAACGNDGLHRRAVVITQPQANSPQ